MNMIVLFKFFGGREVDLAGREILRGGGGGEILARREIPVLNVYCVYFCSPDQWWCVQRWGTQSCVRWSHFSPP